MGTKTKSRSGFGIRIRDEHPGSYFESLETVFGGLIYLNSLMRMWIRIRDPGIFLIMGSGSGMEKILIRDKHPRI
jgi:hypothetical protein